MNSGFHGLRVTPWARESVVVAAQNSGFVVRATRTAPAQTGCSASPCLRAQGGLPYHSWRIPSPRGS